MDMAVANLFKHKAHFQLISEENNRYEPCVFNKGRQYISNEIENLESIGVSNVTELYLKCLEPFIVYIISTLIHEEYHSIDSITALVVLMPVDREYDDYELVEYKLDNPEASIRLFSSSSERRIYSFPEHLLNAPFCIYVDFYSYFISEPLPQPIETYRQEKCVICLEAPPSILYLDCMHIAVCVSCDRVKSNTSLQSTCDMCRAEISKRIKL